MNEIKRFQMEIEAIPLPQGRPRFVRPTGRAYDPPKSKEYKRLIAQLARKAIVSTDMEPFGVDEPLKLYIWFFLPPFKSTKRVKPTGNRDGDLDNYVKLVMDALNGVIYPDDAQIVSIVAAKQYATEPKTILFIERDKCKDSGKSCTQSK